MTTNEPYSINHLDMRQLKAGVKILRAINHPLRLSIIKLVEDNAKLSVTQIYFKLRIDQSVASQHLAILRECNILVYTRSGKNVYYSVNDQKIKIISDSLAILK